MPPYGTDPQGQPSQYSAQGYAQPVAYAAPGVPVKSGGNGLSVAGLVCGIVGVVIGLVPACGAIFAVPLGILSIVFGALGRRSPTGKGMGTAGIVLGAIAIVVSIGWFVLAGLIGGHTTVTTTP